MSDGLSYTLRRSLIELDAACSADRLPGAPPKWVRTRDICGTKAERSARTLMALVQLGLAESIRDCTYKQRQHSWRITSAGRETVKGGTTSTREETT